MDRSLALSPAAARAGGRHDGRPRALIGGRPECATRIAKLRQKSRLGCSRGAARRCRRDRPDHESPRTFRWNARAAFALGAVALGAAAVTALQSFVPGEALTALRSFIPGETQIFQLLLFGWIGVALGRFTVGAEPSPVPRGGQTAARRETAVEGGESRPGPAPHRQGPPDASDRQRELFRAARRRQRAAVACSKAPVRSRTSCWP